MEESDAPLLSQFAKLKLGPALARLADVDSNLLQQLLLEFLPRNGKPVVVSGHRFTTALKIIKQFNELTGESFSVNDLLGASPSSVRKLLAAMVNFGAQQKQRQIGQSTASARKVAFDQWLNEEYIHPALREQPPQVLKAVKFDFAQDNYDLREIIGVGSGLYKTALLFLDLQEGVALKATKKKQTMQKEVIRQVQILASSEFASKDDVVAREDQSPDPLQSMAAEYQRVAQSVMSLGKQLHKVLQRQSQLQGQRAKVESQVAAVEKKLAATKEKAEIQRSVLVSGQDPAGLREQIQKLRSEVDQVGKVGNDRLKVVREQLEQFKRNCREGVDRFRNAKVQSKQIEEEYFRLLQRLEEKEQLREYAEPVEEGVARGVFIRRIAEIQDREKESRKQLASAQAQLDAAKRKATELQAAVDKVLTQTENALNFQRKADDALSSLRQMFKKYRDSYQSLVQTLRQTLKCKQEAKEAEQRKDAVLAKGWKGESARLKGLLQEMQSVS